MLGLSLVAKWLRTKWLGSKSQRGLVGADDRFSPPQAAVAPSGWLLHIERLEDRTLPSVSVSVTGSDVKFVDPNVADTVYLQTTGGIVSWSSDPQGASGTFNP